MDTHDTPPAKDTPELPDRHALDAAAAVLHHQWDGEYPPDTVELVADLVHATGRPVPSRTDTESSPPC